MPDLNNIEAVNSLVSKKNIDKNNANQQAFILKNINKFNLFKLMLKLNLDKINYQVISANSVAFPAVEVKDYNISIRPMALL